MQPRSHSAVFRFGPFEVDLQEGVLRKHNVRVRLQAQPFQILAALLENPGRTVTREELRRRLWPDDTFVDFEHGLNAAVTRLRQALADSAQQPRYIETLAKRGYRFIGEIEGPIVSVVDEPRPFPMAEPSESSQSVSAAERKEPGRWLPKLAPTAAALLFIGVGVWYLVHPGDAEFISRPVPLTAFHGSEVDPALSADGEHVAFAWNGEKQDNFDIYVVTIGSGTPRRVTTDPAHDYSPAWSPDGRTIAFLRQISDDRAAILVVASTGGPEHRIAETRNGVLRTQRRMAALAWTPDGHWVAASHREPGEPREGIYLFSLTGEKRRLTASPHDSYGDHLPAFSPDGQKLAFCRFLGFSSSEIYLLSLDATKKPIDEPLRLTSHNRWATNPVWMFGGSGILYILSQSLNLRAPHEVRITSASGERLPERTIPLEDEVWQISAGRRLVYSRRRDDTNIWRVKIPAQDEPPGSAELFNSSTLADGKARYSPDGSKISFVSSRSGSEEVWISKADGSDSIRMTFFGGPLIGPPSWSPDGQWLVFHARPAGQSDLFIMPAAGGTPRRLTHHPSDETLPTYSRDGRWIYFSSVRSGRPEVWKMPGAGGDAIQVTTGGGWKSIESPDGKTLFYVSDTGNAIRQVPTTGGIEAQVVAPVCAEYGFALTREALLYPMPTSSGDSCEFRLLTLDTGQSRPVLRTAARPIGLVVSVSPDETYFLYEQAERPGIDLMLVENLRLRPLR